FCLQRDTLVCPLTPNREKAPFSAWVFERRRKNRIVQPDSLNVGSNGHPGGQPWRQLQCVSCQGYFSETHGTIFHGKRASVELIVRVIACLAEGLGIRGTARVFEIDPNTVLSWLVEAAEQLQAFSQYFLRDLHLTH